MVDLVQPLLIKHVVRTAAKGDACHHSVLVSMCQTDRVVATSGEPPIDNLLVVDHFLCVDPVQQTRPLPVRARRISLCCWRVTCARDLDDDRSTTLHGPSVHPSSQFGPVTIKPGENKDAWSFLAS